MKTKYSALLVSLALISLSSPALSFQSAEEQPAPQAVSDEPPEDMERVVVYGQKSISRLRKEIMKKTRSFFKDYNKINKDNQYAMVCIKEKKPNTNFKSTTCEPRFIRSNRSKVNSATLLGGDVSALSGISVGGAEGGGITTAPLIFSRLGVVSQAGKMFMNQNTKFQEHVDKVMKENPELQAEYDEIIALQDEMAYKKRNR